jgi:hypothetical protein
MNLIAILQSRKYFRAKTIFCFLSILANSMWKVMHSMISCGSLHFVLLNLKNKTKQNITKTKQKSFSYVAPANLYSLSITSGFGPMSSPKACFLSCYCVLFEISELESVRAFFLQPSVLHSLVPLRAENHLHSQKTLFENGKCQHNIKYDPNVVYYRGLSSQSGESPAQSANIVRKR